MARILIKGATVLTMEKHDAVFHNGEVAIAGDSIIAAGPQGCVPKNFIAEHVIDGSGMVAMPGFINCHTHASMTLLRSYADDLPLMKWLNEKIWPLEAKLQPEDCYWGAMLCCLEMIKSGTTTFADMYFEMDEVALAVEESGIRACLARGMVGAGPAAERAIEENVKLVKDWSGRADGRITTMFGPHAPYTCPPDYLKRVMTLAEKYDAGIHIHVAETQDEIRQIEEKYGMTPVQLLDSIGLFDLPVLAAHCVHLKQEDIAVLAAKKVGVAHCPASNMKLASGIAPVTELLKAGAIVGLGTDGAASNNNLDMMEEMRIASLLHKIATGDPMAMPSFKSLQMATSNGARVLGLGDVGMLKPGMKADLILVDFQRPHLYPQHDLIAHLVYAAQSADVDTVIINGEIVMEDRLVLTIDEEEVMSRAQESAFRLAGR
ncbi:5-methylthioadenosine/S-adenosylhomocysteine deaminase [Pelotomaculum sp. FP]|uniref:amidohydrolase n=1 Tax=Pelotomaculum sp. FP TaxID=261474 RepID=UPI0010650253|nr:amidohydrolase [Pelotomaculum sp. FP]TEB14504.1 5-methylthioadenosine/S-adenosylhomocysteine deaminase [Pelotomaculum sp. FP]